MGFFTLLPSKQNVSKNEHSKNVPRISIIIRNYFIGSYRKTVCKTIFLLLFITCIITDNTSAQNAIVGTGFSTGWGGGTCPTGNSNFKYLSAGTGSTYILQTTANATGTSFWRFGVDWSGTTGQYTITPGSNTAVTLGTKYSLNTGCTTNGALDYNTTTGYNYIFKTLNAGTNPTGTFVFFEVQGTVQTVSSVSQAPTAASVTAGQNVVVTANISGALSTGQGVYLRYTNSGYSSSTIVQMTGSGTTYTATIPGSNNTSGTPCSYYVFTSGSGLTIAGSDADLYTINLNNNSGADYAYTVISSGTWVGPTSGGDWNTAANWSGGIPTSSTNVTIPAGNIVNIGTANAVANSVTIAGTGGINFSSATAYTLSISSGGSFTNNGTFTAGIGSLILLATTTSISTIAGSSTTTFNNLTIYGNTTMSSATIINGTLLFNPISAGSSFAAMSGTSPSYSCSALLEYNTGITQARGAEWTTATSGAGFPGSVWVTGNTVINGNNSGSNNIALCKDLTIDNGSALYMDYGSTGNSSLTVGGNTLVNGNLSLGYGSGGDLFMYGNFTIGASANINYNTSSHSFANTGGGGRSINFIGSGTQVITYTPTGTLNIPIININQNTTGGELQLATGTNISIPDYGSTLNALKLLQGNLDLNGQSLTLNGSNGDIGVSGSIRTITGIAGSTLNISGNKIVNSLSGGTLVTDLNVKVITSASLDCGPSVTTINGILQLNGGSFVYNNSPFYGSSSKLIYNTANAFATPYNRNSEWNGNTSFGTVGFPNNVEISNNTYVLAGGSSHTGTNLNMGGSLTIDAGSTFDMSYGGATNMTVPLEVAGNISIAGTLIASGVAGGDIYVSGNWTRTGTFTDNSRAVFFNGATNGIITATGGQTFSYALLTKSTTTAKITLADSVTITKQLTLTEGTLDLANRNIIITSARSNTASIGATTTPANVTLTYSGTGRFEVQRFFAAHRAWRLVTAPFTSGTSLTINQAWQEGVVNTSNTIAGIVNPDPGYGTLITGAYSGTSGEVYGFDPGTQANPSIYYFNGTTWLAPANTTGTNVNAYPGYMLFVRGNRNYIIGTQYTPADTATLNPAGQINVGDQTVTASGAGFKVIGNPYASGFNFITSAETGLSGYDATHPDIYEWDPLLTGSNSVGAFVTLHWNGSRYTCVPSPDSPIDSVNLRIESSAAFLVKFTGSGSVTIHETDKTLNNALVFRPANTITETSLRANLYAYNADSTVSLNDGVLNLFDPSYNNAINNADVAKFGTVAENISLKRYGHSFAIESRQPVISQDSVFYNLSQLGIKKYCLQLIGTNLATPGLIGYLQDTLLHTSTLINLDGTTNIDFNIPDAETATQSAGRFIVVFRKAAAPLPVTFTSVQAVQQAVSIASVMISWSVANELNTKEYEIEKSTDDKTFVAIGTTNAVGNNYSAESYSWLDANANNGNNFYRIKSIDVNGEIQYSDIVNATIVNMQTGISIYPNPVVDGKINIQLNNMPKGTYDMQILNTDGQLVATDQLVHAGGTIVKVFSMKNYMAGGIYNLEVIHPDKSKTVITFVAEGK